MNEVLRQMEEQSQRNVLCNEPVWQYYIITCLGFVLEKLIFSELETAFFAFYSTLLFQVPLPSSQDTKVFLESLAREVDLHGKNSVSGPGIMDSL
jgi:hypothetical protein